MAIDPSDFKDDFNQKGIVLVSGFFDPGKVQSCVEMASRQIYEDLIPPNLEKSRVKIGQKRSITKKIEILLLDNNFKSFCEEISGHKYRAVFSHLSLFTVEGGERLSLHADLDKDTPYPKKLAFSISLSRRFPTGCPVSIHDGRTKELITTCEHERAGDFTLMHIDQKFLHGVGPATLGERINLAGWFY